MLADLLKEGKGREGYITKQRLLTACLQLLTAYRIKPKGLKVFWVAIVIDGDFLAGGNIAQAIEGNDAVFKVGYVQGIGVKGVVVQRTKAQGNGTFLLVFTPEKIVIVQFSVVYGR